LPNGVSFDSDTNVLLYSISSTVSSDINAEFFAYIGDTYQTATQTSSVIITFLANSTPKIQFDAFNMRMYCGDSQTIGATVIASQNVRATLTTSPLPTGVQFTQNSDKTAVLNYQTNLPTDTNITIYATEPNSGYERQITILLYATSKTGIFNINEFSSYML
jgi:predicted nucleic acid-binding protein